MSNFYGGRDGRSFILVKEFASVEEMATQFAKGPSYKTVQFDEYVIIRTENQANPENGMVFRRGYDYNSDRTIEGYTLNPNNSVYTDIRGYEKKADIISGGAVYVGKISGPSGEIPYLDFVPYENATLEKLQKVTEAELDNIPAVDLADPEIIIEKMNSKYPNGYTYGNNLVTDMVYIEPKTGDVRKYFLYLDTFFNNFEESVSDQRVNLGWRPMLNPLVKEMDMTSEGTHPNYIPTVEYETDLTLVNGRLPIKEDTWQDNVKWYWAFLNDENNTKAIYKIGMKMPYMVHEFYANSVDAYYNRSNNTNNFTNSNLITPISDELTQQHPLFKRWDVKIPKGIKGESFRNLRVTTSRAESQAITGYATEDDRQIYVVDYYNYDLASNPVKEIIYLGDYNQIKNVSFEDDGTLTIQYTHEDTDTYNQFITWLKSFTLSDKGALNITFNNNKIGSISKTLKWIDNIQFNNGDGESQKIVVTYNTGAKIESQPINIIEEIKIEEKHLKIKHSEPNRPDTDENRWQDLGSLSFFVSDNNQPANNELNTGGIWLITQEV